MLPLPEQRRSPRKPVRKTPQAQLIATGTAYS
jgi:hypothetical protein